MVECGRVKLTVECFGGSGLIRSPSPRLVKRRHHFEVWCLGLCVYYWRPRLLTGVFFLVCLLIKNCFAAEAHKVTWTTLLEARPLVSDTHVDLLKSCYLFLVHATRTPLSKVLVTAWRKFVSACVELPSHVGGVSGFVNVLLDLNSVLDAGICHSTRDSTRHIPIKLFVAQVLASDLLFLTERMVARLGPLEVLVPSLAHLRRSYQEVVIRSRLEEIRNLVVRTRHRIFFPLRFLVRVARHGLPLWHSRA